MMTIITTMLKQCDDDNGNDNDDDNVNNNDHEANWHFKSQSPGVDAACTIPVPEYLGTFTRNQLHL